ncbi:hypothetical protein [Hyphobacterium sp.]|uniref:hypothetical protein n=1 Tax=Hyphobacterium sp. TaxID=2004662 RepID=UPI003BAA961A
MLDVILFLLLILILAGLIGGILYFALGLREKTISELEANSSVQKSDDEAKE